jgi:hypothetical protein
MIVDGGIPNCGEYGFTEGPGRLLALFPRSAILLLAGYVEHMLISEAMVIEVVAVEVASGLGLEDQLDGMGTLLKS